MQEHEALRAAVIPGVVDCLNANDKVLWRLRPT